MAIMVTSFRVSLDAWLNEVLPADLYGRAGRASETGFLDPAQQAMLRAIPGVAQVRFVRHQNLLLDPGRPAVALLARSLGAAPGEIGLPMVAGGASSRSDLPPLWITEAMVDLHGWAPGQVVQLPLAGRSERFVVAGVWRDYARQHGAVALDIEVYRRLTGDERVNVFSVWLAPGHGADAVAAAISQRLEGGERLEIARPGEIRQVSLRLFDRSFAVTYALEAVAILIGLAGVAASFGALAAARRREFGMLRHIGMTRRQIGAMLAVEGALVSALGVAAGLTLGLAIGLLLIHVVNRQSFHWSMEMHVLVGALGGFGLAMVTLAVLVSVVAARQAMRVEAVRAVREDW
jgi:putative ABC transport system permease protein